MIEINLLPQELRKKEALRLVIPNIFNRRFVVTLAGVLLTAHAVLGALTVYQTTQRGRTQNQVDSLRELMEETIGRKSEIKAGRERLDQIERMTERQFSWAKLLNVLSDSVPKGLWLRSFTVEEEMGAAAGGRQPASPAPAKVHVLKLEGSVVGNGQETAVIGRFIKSLKEDAYFSLVFDEVEFFNITQRRIKSFSVYDFAIVCVFKNGKF